MGFEAVANMCGRWIEVRYRERCIYVRDIKKPSSFFNETATT